MNHELVEIIQAISEKSLHLMRNFEPDDDHVPKFVNQCFDFSSDYLQCVEAWFNHPAQVQDMQAAYWKDAIGLCNDQFVHYVNGTVMPIDDKRFSSTEWVDNVFFNMLTQHYLLAREHITLLLEKIEFSDEKLAHRVRFFTRQYLDALSPDNFIHTNPHLMAETIQSHGKNLLLGLKNLLTDIEVGSSRFVMTMTDKNAFKVGENIAVTPGKVIYRNEMMELIQYTPQTTKARSVPLLIVPPWINKYYILDLSPQNSFIRWLVEQHITVFVISWVNPDVSHAQKGMTDYLMQGPGAAVEVIKAQLNVKQVNALGFCIGGTLLTMLLAYHKAIGDDSIGAVTFLATLIDFSDPGDIAVFMDEKQISKVEALMQKKGFLDGQFMANAFNSLRASDLVWTFFIRNYLHGKPPVAFDMLFWNTDTTNMPEKMHSQYLRWMYLHNDLVKVHKLRVNDVPINVRDIDHPAFFLSTKKDHIAPWQTTYLGFQMMQGEKRFVLGGSGHIAGIVIPPGSEKYGYYVNGRNPGQADSWLAGARYHTGSWWPEWLSWLNKHSGRLVKAPVMTDLVFKPLVDAPGSYVFQCNQRN